jgi:cell division septation protein DedD
MQEQRMDPEEKTEEQLAAELEDMYKRVASVEKPAEADDQGEEILVRQPPEETATALATAVVVETAGNNAAEVPPPLLHPPLPQSGRRMNAFALAAVLVCICVLIYSAIFWPTLYDVAMIHRDGNLYPIRINRITGNVVYLDGEQWRNTPVSASIPPVPMKPMPVATAPASEASVPAPKVPVAEAPPAAQTATLLQKEALPERRPAPAPATLQAQTQASSTHPEKQTPPREALKDRRFAIQIKSYNNPAEARELVEDLRKMGMEADVVAAPVGDRGIWNRVLIGRFKYPGEALKFMQKHRIKDAYPGSFIQKRSP